MQVSEVQGRRVAWSVTGEGSPTVLLETGVGAESAEWAPVEEAVERSMRVFRYDRAGRGQSEPASGRRDAATMVEELEAVLEAAEVKGPLLLVGHSFGGLLMRLFARRRRAEVCGMVLVESMHRRQFQVLGPAFPEARPEEPPPLTGMRAFWSGGWRAAGSTPERIDFEASFLQDATVESLGDLPMEVLAAWSFQRMPGVREADRERLQELADGLQESFLSLSSRSRLLHVTESGHFVQRDAPGAIVEAIERVRRQM